MYARGGVHSDAYCVQQGGWGGLKIRKNAYVINGRPLGRSGLKGP